MRRLLSRIWEGIKRNPVITGLGVVIVVLLIADITFGALYAHKQWSLNRVAQDYSANIATELISILVTVVIVGWLFRRQQTEELKQQLIWDMGGQVEDFALRAVRELRVNGGLTDGTLTGANLIGAELTGANLEGAELNRAKYSSRTIWPKDFPPPPEAINWDDESTWPEGFTAPKWYKKQEDGDDDG